MTRPDSLSTFLERMTRNAAYLAGGLAVLYFVRSRWAMAYSIVVAAAVFTWSLRWQAQALASVLQEAAAGSGPADERDDTRAPASSPGFGASMFLRVPALLLALAALLWYTPAQPLGVIYGVGCVLIGAIFAALEPAPTPPPQD